MASYSAPSSKYTGIYNPNYFIGREDETLINGVLDAAEITGNYVKLDGTSIMQGRLTTPEILLFNGGTVRFDDNTEQSTAFTSSHVSDIETNKQKLTNVTSSNDDTTISGSLQVRSIVFLDDGSEEQTAAFQQSHVNDISANKQKLTNSTFDSQTGLLTISNLHATALTSGTFNSSHLSGTLSNVQAQLTTLSSDVTPLKTNCQQISYDSQTLTTVIPDDIELENVFCDKITLNGSVQTDAYTSELDEMLRSANSKTVHITASQTGQPSTVISGGVSTNFLSLYNGYSALGKITFPDLSEQTTAYSEVEQSKTQHQSAALLAGGIKLTLFGGTVQANILKTGELKFSDGSSQSTAFTSTDKTNISNIANIATNTQNITSLGSFTEINGFLNCHNTVFLEDQVKLTFYNQDQNYAYTDADRNKLQSLTINNGIIPSNKIGTGIISDAEFNCLNNCTYNIQNALNSLNIPKMSQTFTLDSNVILQNGDTIFAANTEYGSSSSNVTIDMRSLGGFDPQWQSNGIMNNNNEFIKLGVYLINVRATLLNLKWYRKCLLKFFNVYYPNYNDGFIPEGIELNSSTSNESDKYFAATHVIRVTNTQYTYFNLRLEYWFASALSGSSQLNMEIQITEL
jgi:hypothetical protein